MRRSKSLSKGEESKFGNDPALLLKELIEQSRKVEAQKKELAEMNRIYQEMKGVNKELKRVTEERNDQYNTYKTRVGETQ